MNDIKSVARVCPRCGRWSAPSRDGGKTPVCSCGAAAPVAAGEGAGDIYELAPEPANASAGASAPAAGGERHRTLSYRAPKDEAPGRAEPQTIRDLYLPLWLLGGGVVVEVIAAVIQERQLAGALIHVGLELSIGTTLMLAGILLAAWFRKIDFGRFWVAVFKLAAISVAPSAAVALFTPVLIRIPLLGGLIGLAGAFVLYFALLGALFDLDQSDTWYCVCVIFLVHLGVYFLLLGIGVR